jgi:N-alpha-acetyl-L-2,4-diaminobutyrate deacetylase
MTRQIVSPESLDLESPGRRDYWVALGHTSIWGSHLIPLTVLVGPQAKPGEGLVAFGGNHGNEYEGPVALRNLLREIRTEDVLGRLVLVPVLNVAAFHAGTRESTKDDGLNLNRVFVEGAGATPAMASITYRIAAFVRERIWPHVHISLDLHSGGEVARFAHWAGFFTCQDAELNARREEMARWFGTRIVMSGPNPPPGGVLRGLYNEADDLGKYSIGTELGYGSATDVHGVRAARQGVLAAAIHHGQLRGTIEPIGHHADGTQSLVGNASSVAAPYPGHYEALVDCGEVVAKGRTVGLLHDFYRLDEEPFEVTAGVAGIVVAQAWSARVDQGQLILMVAEEIG